jgi:hypothetical protein
VEKHLTISPIEKRQRSIARAGVLMMIVSHVRQIAIVPDIMKELSKCENECLLLR